MKLPLQVDVIIFCKIDGEYKYLMMQRTDERGGFWQPVTGGVEEGEKIVDAVYREVYEESGYTKDRIARIIDLDYSFQFKLKNKDFYITEYVFAAEVTDPDFVRLEKEHQKVEWCNFDESVEHLTWDTNIETLKKLKDILHK